MPFGIKPAVEEYQQDVLTGLAGIAVIAEDILEYRHGDSMVEAVADHGHNLPCLLERGQGTWVLLDPVRSQKCPPGNPLLVHQFTEIGADQQVPAQHRVPSSLDPLYGVVRRYLDVVQQNPFPTELLRMALNEPSSVRTSQVVRYQAGYLVCALIAALFFVAVPATGLCFCCCRRRRGCGGRLKADRRSLACRRNLLASCLSLATAILLAGVICAFIANQRVTEQMEPGARAVPATLHTLRKNIGSIPQGVQSVVDQFAVPRQQIIGDLNRQGESVAVSKVRPEGEEKPEIMPDPALGYQRNIMAVVEVCILRHTGFVCVNVSRSIGLTIHSLLKEQVYSVLEAIQGRAQDLQNSLHHLQILNKTVRTLTHFQDELGLALRDRKESTVSLLDSPRCTSCARALGKAQSLEPGADYRRVPSVEQVLKTLSGLPKANFPDLIDKLVRFWGRKRLFLLFQGNSTFNSMPDLAVVKMAQVVQELKDEVNKVSEKVQSIADSFPVSDYTQPLNDALMHAENKSRPYLQEVKHYEKYRWIVGIVLCSVVLLVVACNLLGLSLGACGLAMREDPSDYESRGEAGAKLLLVGIGFSFLFSWLLILLVFATFLVGGNVQTLLCKNWANQEIYKFIDTPGNLPPSMNLTQLLSLKRNLNLTSAYQVCKKGTGLWDILQLRDTYNLEDHLHLSQYTRDFQKRLNNFNLQFEEIHFLDGAGRRDLETFQQSGIDQLDYPTFQAEMQNPVVRTSLEDLARDLEGLRKIQNNITIAGRLANESQALWKIQNATVLTQEALVVKLNESVQFLSALAPHLQPLLKRTMAEIALVETMLPGQAQRLLRHEISCFTRKELGYFSQYLNWVRRTLTEDVASCQPLATALDNGRVILCDRIAEPWNAFWFSLGCCTLFLIPSIIFAIKLTKHFRPIRNRLISTASEETYPFHIPRVTALKL
ncbi:prominin-2 [Eretmochelys imbricata]